MAGQVAPTVHPDGSPAMLRPTLLLTALLVPPAFVAVAQAQDDPPLAPREFRGVWVATVGNIDWPSKPGLTTEQQKAEALAILGRVAELNLNAVIFQVRTAADALYRSDLEPWSAVLTGTQGQAPEPFYDPLAFWVAEAHRRGLQLHAWLNPFRAKPAGAKYETAATHVSKAHPDWVKSYGEMLWMDPGIADARDHTLRVVADVLNRYNVDGIHIDDYFYPYPVSEGGQPVDFPDDASWALYQDTGGRLNRADWRRENVNRLVEGMYRLSRDFRPGVQFGVSPFGIPRPGRPEGVVGFDQYASLYADTELWLRNGWCDYWTPQLYWRINAPGQPFRPLLNYWIEQNQQGRHVWPGLSSSRIREGERGYRPSEILGQIAIIRAAQGDDGNVLFSMKSLMANRLGFCDQLKDGPYRLPALVPTTPWLDDAAPARPSVEKGDQPDTLTVRPGPGEPPFLWAVWTQGESGWTFAVRPASSQVLAIDPAARKVVITAVDRLGNESQRTTVEPGGPPRP
jgi:uncharacterized lipoprotein YddW (UPF0748 family)